MDGSQPGELGVIAWCNTIRFNMAKDPGRAFLDNQIQKQGFDFLESYLASVVSRPKQESVYELLKTPGRKKDAPKRTRAATAAASKAKAAIQVSLEDEGNEKENLAPVNSFHQALLDAKNKDEEDMNLESEPQAAVHFASDDGSHSKRASPVDTKASKSVEVSNDEVQEEPEETPAASAASPPKEEEDKPTVEDDDTVMQPTISEPQAELHVPAATSKELSMIAEDEEEPSRIEQQGEDNGDVEIMVPLKDDDDSTAKTLNRKPSLSQFGLPAPSPLRKSMRHVREPSTSNLAAPPLAHTPGVGAGKRTSWLTKAKEAKALEMTDSGKKVGGLTGLGFSGVVIPVGGSKKRKSEDMLGADLPTTHKQLPPKDNEERRPKTPKLMEPEQSEPTTSTVMDIEEDFTQVTSTLPAQSAPHVAVPSVPPTTEVTDSRPVTRATPELISPVDNPTGEGALNRFKKITEGLGARAGKSMGKSLGGNAAAALAEARKAAEARVAQRNKEDGLEVVVEAAASSSPHRPQTKEEAAPAASSSHESEKETERRLSVSDLVPAQEQKAPKQYSVFSKPPPSFNTHVSRTQIADGAANLSTSTTPPNSPPPSSVVPPAPQGPRPLPVPVFSKPPASMASLFDRPQPSGSHSNPDFSFKLPRANPFTIPASMHLGVPATFQSSSSQSSIFKQAGGLSAQSSKGSIFSDPVFDSQDSAPAWMPSTQDTDYDFKNSQYEARQRQLDELEEQDRWNIQDKFEANQIWTPHGFVSADAVQDDTWSTMTSHSGGKHTGPLPPTQSLTEALQQAAQEPDEDETGQRFEAGTDDIEEADIGEADIAMDIDDDDAPLDSDLDDIIAAGKSTISLVKTNSQAELRSQSQMSMTSTSSSQSQQSQLGLFGQATKLLSSVLGGGKKKAEPVKSIQRAAAAAKKQQEEAERKATRLREMENRRQQAMQRKAEEEKARLMEEERKYKEEAEKRKREREEHTGKRPLTAQTKKGDDDTTKKGKLVVELPKKPATSKPPSRDNQPSRLGKPAAASGSKPLKSALKAQPSSSSLAKEPSSKSLKPTASSSSLRPPTASSKGKGKAQYVDESEDHPSQMLQSQMAHRAKAQMQAAEPRAPPPVPSESIELPDINSEYSDSEDEDRPKTFDPPEWAQSPELKQALEQQATMNPDDLFGPIVPLKMEEIFKTRQSRFRARTSSANWSGADQLTAEEELAYAKRMGYIK